jgi:Motility quorum-sensing regulator, toxin of MqsA
MSRWLARILTRIRELATEGNIRLTAKAVVELAAFGPGIDVEDVRDVLLRLTAVDSAGRMRSVRTGEWMYVFKPLVAGEIAYIKLIVRVECVVVSFHGDEGVSDEEED